MAFPVMFTRAPPAMMLELGEMAMGVGNVVVPAFHNANTVRRLQIPIQRLLCSICAKSDRTYVYI